MTVDAMLTNGRSELISTVSSRVQMRLDAIAAGIDLVSLEMTELGPPRPVVQTLPRFNPFGNRSTNQRAQNQRIRATQMPLAKAAASRLFVMQKPNHGAIGSGTI